MLFGEEAGGVGEYGTLIGLVLSALGNIGVGVAYAMELRKKWAQTSDEIAQRGEKASERQRKSHQAKVAEDFGIPYKSAWQIASEKLDKALEGMNKLIDQKAEHMVEIASLRKDKEYCEAANKALIAEREQDRKDMDLTTQQMDKANGEISKLWDRIHKLQGGVSQSEGKETPEKGSGI